MRNSGSRSCLAAHSSLGAWRRKTTSNGTHTHAHTYLESTHSTHVDKREEEDRGRGRDKSEVENGMGKSLGVEGDEDKND